ncbi:RNA recognition motif domain - like 10 [Theobroma cacao]|nr:RNA recognition motif domain - like 10 [Theobroma cacao]
MVAMATRNNTLMNGKAIRMTWPHDEYKPNDDANLFVEDSSIDNMKLQAIFAKYGNILSCKVQVFDNGNSKGYGYVQFETPESAQKAIEELNGRDIKGKNMYPVSPASLYMLCKSTWERMNGHTIAHDRNHPFQHSYPQRVVGANNMRNGHQIVGNNEGVVRVPTATAAFSAFNPFGF